MRVEIDYACAGNRAQVFQRRFEHLNLVILAAEEVLNRLNVVAKLPAGSEAPHEYRFAGLRKVGKAFDPSTRGDSASHAHRARPERTRTGGNCPGARWQRLALRFRKKEVVDNVVLGVIFEDDGDDPAFGH